MNLQTYQQCKAEPSLTVNARMTLRAYSREPSKEVDAVLAPVKYKSQKKNLAVLVVKGQRQNLGGWDWFQELKLNWEEIFKLDRSTIPAFQEILYAHPATFKERLGTLDGVKARIYTQDGVIPNTLKQLQFLKVSEKKTDWVAQIGKEGIISPVQFSEWVTCTVPVVKPKTIHIYGNYKVRCVKASG